MKRQKKLMLFGSLVTLAAILLGYGLSLSEPDAPTKLKMKMKKPQKTEERMIAYNNWNYAMRNDGSYLYRASQSAFGGEFPRGTNYGCVYAAGLYVGGKKPGVGGAPDTINVANVEFSSEFLPGKILINGQKDLKYRGYVTPNSGADTTKTAPLGTLAGDDYLIDEYKVYVIDQGLSGYDYTNWPVYAPRNSENNPLFLSGAAAQSYVVFNDMSTARATPDGNDPNMHSPRFGLETELESFVFTTGLLNNGIFFKLSITNKAQKDYHDAYIGIWADPDVGSEYSDDMAGVDTNRGLGLVYSNPTGADPAKTALGLDFLQGPVVDTTEVPRNLIEKFYYHPSGAYRKVLKFDPVNSLLEAVNLPASKFRLGATAFISYPNPLGEPTRNSGDLTRWWYMAGLDMLGNPKPGGNYDPTASGNNPGDQRIIHGVGPFILRSGQTQEIWFAVAGGQGTSNGPGTGTIYNPQVGSALYVLQNVDDAMQTAFDNALVSPIPPATPHVNVAVESGKVILTWDNRSEYTYDRFGDLLNVKQPLFNKNWIGIDFQGYRVYKSLTGFEGSWKMVAEYDKIDGITVENDTLIDGTPVKNVRFGSDSGVRHYYIDTDVINQRVYYYSVTAYDYQPLFRLGTAIAGYPRSLESPMTAKSALRSAVPMAPPAGVTYDGSYVKSLQKAAGTYSNLYVDADVISAKNITSYKSYIIEFFELDTITVNNRRLRGVTPGTLAFRMKDSASGEYVKFDNYSDNPLTFFDSLPGNGVFGKEDSIFNDAYYSTAIGYTDLLGNLKEPTSTPPRLNGISIKLVSDTIGVKDFVEIRDANGPVTPRSVFYQISPTGLYDIVAGGDTSIIASTVKVTAANRNAILLDARTRMNFFNVGYITSTSDYEIRFTGTDTSAVYMPNGTGTSNLEYSTLSYAQRRRVPFEMWKIGYYDNPNDTNDYRIALKSRGLPPAAPVSFTMNNTLGRFYINNTNYGPYGALSERMTVIDTAYFFASANFPRISPWRIKVVDILMRSHKDTAAFPPQGTVIRVEMFRPVQPGNQFIYRQIPNSPRTVAKAKKTMKEIKVVPNPYYGRVLEYQSSLFDKKVKFTNLPDVCTIRIFNVAGDLIRTIYHNGTSYNNRIDYDPLNRTKDIGAIPTEMTSTEEWDLRNSKGAFVASGMYIALIEAPGVGKQTVKFAIIQEEMRIDGPDVR